MKRIVGILLGGFVGILVGEPGAVVVGVVVGWLVAELRSDTDDQPPGEVSDEILNFVTAARREGLIAPRIARRLTRFRERQLADAPATVADTTPAHPAIPLRIEPARRDEGRAPVGAGPQPIRAHPSVPLPPAAPSPLAIGLRRLGRNIAGVWRTFSADVAIHTLTYFGVLLLALVMFAFFGLGFYGDLVGGDRWRPWRPVVVLAVPSVLFGMAWLLRTRTGIALTANAIGFVAALSLPIVLSSLFQDGAWGVPDLDGPARWMGYAGVGAVCSLVFAVAARRSTMYAYLIGPGVWVAVGALGLYLEDGLPLAAGTGVRSFDQFTSDGISWMQLVAVLIAMTLTLLVLRLARRRGPIAVRVARTALVCLPVVAGFAAGFAVTPGITSGVDPTAAPTSILAASGAVTLLLLGTDFAWADFGVRLRRWLALALAATTITLAGAGWVASTLIGVAPAWMGVGLAGYAAALLAAGPRLGVRALPALAALRLAGVVGLALALVDALPAVVGWGVASIALGCGEAVPRWRRTVDRIVPVADPVARSAILAVGVAAAVSGAVRLSPGAARPGVILTAALIVALARYAPARALRDLSPFAVGFAAAGAGHALYLGGGTLSWPTVGWLLLAAAIPVAVAEFPWVVRLPTLMAALVPGAMLAWRSTHVSGAVIDAAVTAVAGTALLALGLAVPWPTRGVADGLGHLLLWSSPFFGGWSDAGLFLGLAAVSLAHLARGALEDRDIAGAIVPVVAAPFHLLTGALLLPVVAVMGAHELAWFAAERPRSAFLLAGVAWLYTLLSGVVRSVVGRRSLAVLSSVLAAAAVLVAVPSSTALLITSWSGAAVLGWQAVVGRSPGRSILAWGMALTAGVATAARLGVGRDDLHEPLFAGAVILIAVGAASYRTRLRSWGLAPLGLGLLVLPAALSFVIADGGRIALFAGVAAIVYTVLAVVVRTAALTPVVGGMVAIAYADLLPAAQNPLLEPVWWLPLAAGFLGLAAVPWRIPAGHWLVTLTPGLHATWAAVVGIAAAGAAGSEDFARIMIAAAALTGIAAARWRSRVTGYGALVLVAWAGLAAGGGWWALALGTNAVVVAADAIRRPDATARMVLAPIATTLLGGAVVALGAWQRWSLLQVVVIALVAAAVAGTLAVAITVARPGPRLAIWEAPLHLLAQVGLVAATVVGMDGYRWTPDAFAALTVALGLETLGFVVVATAGRLVRGTAVATASAATTLIAGRHWADLTVGEVVAASGVVAGVSLVLGLGLLLTADGSRPRMWWAAAGALAQAAGVVTVVTALRYLDPTPAAVITAVVLAAEGLGLLVLGWRLPRYGVPTGAAAGLSFAVSVLAALEAVPVRLGPVLVVGVMAVGAGLMVLASNPGEQRWKLPATASAWVLAVGVPLASLRFESDPALAAVLMVAGAGIVVGAIVGGRWRASYLGIGAWALAVWVAFGGGPITDPNLVVAPVAGLVLLILALEDLRARFLDAPHPAETQQLAAGVEVVAMAAALATAGWSAYAGSSAGHLLLLGGEAGVLVVWALVSRVRRRLALGVLGLVAVTLYPVVRLMASLLRGGASGGVVLGIGAAVAVLFIVVGSLLERGRARVGATVRRLTEAMEDWR